MFAELHRQEGGARAHVDELHCFRTDHEHTTATSTEDIQTIYTCLFFSSLLEIKEGVPVCQKDMPERSTCLLLRTSLHVVTVGCSFSSDSL